MSCGNSVLVDVAVHGDRDVSGRQRHSCRGARPADRRGPRAAPHWCRGRYCWTDALRNLAVTLWLPPPVRFTPDAARVESAPEVTRQAGATAS